MAPSHNNLGLTCNKRRPTYNSWGPTDNVTMTGGLHIISRAHRAVWISKYQLCSSYVVNFVCRVFEIMLEMKSASPRNVVARSQTDSWSCGLHLIVNAEYIMQVSEPAGGQSSSW